MEKISFVDQKMFYELEDGNMVALHEIQSITNRAIEGFMWHIDFRTDEKHLWISQTDYKQIKDLLKVSGMYANSDILKAIFEGKGLK